MIGSVVVRYVCAIWMALWGPYCLIAMGTVGEYVITAGVWLDNPDPRYAGKWTRSEAQQGYRRSTGGDMTRLYGSSTEFVGPPSFDFKLGKRWSAFTRLAFGKTWHWYWGAVFAIATISGCVSNIPRRCACGAWTTARCGDCRAPICGAHRRLTKRSGYPQDIDVTVCISHR